MTPEEKELIKGATPHINEKTDRHQLPVADVPDNFVNEELDEGFKSEDQGTYKYVEVEDIIADENYEDNLINSIDRRREQSKKDKDLHRASKN
ncbi:MAG: hypothetical protein WC543_06700 [Candidatus Omnitrophota bacterium]